MRRLVAPPTRDGVVTPPSAGGVELTDDFAPLERMQIAKVERYRALFVARIAPALLLR